MQANEDLQTTEAECVFILCVEEDERWPIEKHASRYSEKGCSEVNRLEAIQLGPTDMQLPCVLPLLVLQAQLCLWDSQKIIPLAREPGPDTSTKFNRTRWKCQPFMPCWFNA